MTTKEIAHTFDCPRCNAKGYLDQFKHIANGVCFLCKGAKKVSNLSLLTQKTGKHNSLHCALSVSPSEDLLIIYEFHPKRGAVWSSTFTITEENKASMRGLWQECKAQGFEMKTTYEKRNANYDLGHIRQRIYTSASYLARLPKEQQDIIKNLYSNN